MFRNSVIFTIAASLACLPGFAQKSYTHIDLGLLPGTNTAYVAGINALHHVVGSSQNVTKNFVYGGDGWFWNGSKLIDLGVVGATGLNDYDEVVGSAGYVWDPSHGLRDLYSMLSPQDQATWPNVLMARGINNNHVVVGDSYQADGEGHAFLMDISAVNLSASPPVFATITDLGFVAGAVWARGNGLNNNASPQAVGQSHTTSYIGVLMQGGTTPVSLAPMFSAYAVNDFGAVAGGSVGGSAGGAGYRDPSGTLFTIPNQSNTNQSEGKALNNAATVTMVGDCLDKFGNPGGPAWRWTVGATKLISLDSLTTDRGGGGSIIQAHGVTNDGYIAATAKSGSYNHAWLLIPH